MTDYKQHEKLKQLSLSAYRGKKNNTDYEEINTITNYLTGFRAKIYKNGLNIVIAYCGSDSLLDWTISWNCWGRNPNLQAHIHRRIYTF
ncbi:hypothetical protein IKQ21_08470 [bacterium]|nr:hypothetical protein [bacterium]